MDEWCAIENGKVQLLTHAQIIEKGPLIMFINKNMIKAALVWLNIK